MTIQLPVDPAPSAVVDWTSRYAAILATVRMRAVRPEHEPMVEQARLDALQRIELGIAESLQRGGSHPEAAAYQAFAYVSRCVAIASSSLAARA